MVGHRCPGCGRFVASHVIACATCYADAFAAARRDHLIAFGLREIARLCPEVLDLVPIPRVMK